MRQAGRQAKNVSFAQAAAVPVSATTALQALCDVARVEQGQSMLIVGASGGVGSFAVQLAKAFGAEVTGVCSTKKLDLVLHTPVPTTSSTTPLTTSRTVPTTTT